MDEFIKGKIKKVDELEKIVAKLKKKGKKVVQCHGAFDLVHPGHLYHFEAAKRHGEVLIVSITADEFVRKGPSRPIFPEAVRAKNLANFHIVDYVLIHHDVSAVNLLKKIRPDVYFKGQEYESALSDPNRNLFKEAKAVESFGGKIMFSHEETFSSSKLLKNFFDIYPEDTKAFLKNFENRYTSKDITNFFKDIENIKVLVIGETIIDEYNYVKPMGKVPKDNLVASKYLTKEIFAGGILAVANHIAGFCNNVDLVSALGGKSSHENFVRNNLKKNVNAKFFFEEEGKTILKKRFLDSAFFNKMFEVYYFDDKDISESLSKKITKYLENVISKYDLVIVNDYGHGFFTQEIIDVLIKKANFLAVNTQTNSANFGFNLITKYSKANYVCIDEPEARLATQKKRGDICEVADEIFKKINVKELIITRGHLGSVAKEKGKKVSKVPVFSVDIVDRVGAGDAFFAITSLLAVKKEVPMEALAFVGNAVGALQVAVMGNKTPVEQIKLFKFIQTLLK